MAPQLVNVGYLVPAGRAGMNGYKRRAEHAKKAGVRLLQVPTTAKNRKKLLRNSPLDARWWNGSHMEESTVMLPRVFYDRTSVWRASIRTNRFIKTLRETGVHFINDRDLRKFAMDKWLQYKLLRPAGIAIPHSTQYSLKNCLSFVRRYPLVFVKKRNGTQGSGQLIIKRRGKGFVLRDVKVSYRQKSVTKNFRGETGLIRYLSRLDLSNYIVQRGVKVERLDEEHPRVYDFRVIMQRDGRGVIRLTLAYIRVSAPNSLQSNMHRSGHAQDIESVFIDAEAMYKQLKRVGTAVMEAIAETFEVGELGIDFVRDENGKLWLLEVNSRPGSKGIQQLREWVPKDRDFVRDGWLVFENDTFTNTRRRKWGKRFTTYMRRPYRYARFLAQ